MGSVRFRWVYCQLDNLRRCMPSSIRKALNELPVTLDDTYERILQNIPKQKWQHAHRLFQCMVAALRPLRVEELAEIFAVGFGPNAAPNLVEEWRPENPEEAVFSACSTLITIITDSDADSDVDSYAESYAESSKIVQFSHFSVKEYLTSDRLQTSDVPNIRQFHVSLELANANMARVCLAVLLQLEEKMDKERFAAFPLALYAAQNWVDHAKFENVASHIQDAMEDLFNPMKPQLWAWIRTHDIDDCKGSVGSIDDVPSTLALYYAMLCGFGGLAKHLIVTYAIDVNEKLYDRPSPLFKASQRGHVDVAQVLLDYGADVNAQVETGATPLHWASCKGHLKFVQLLLEHGATVNTTDYDRPPLHLAVESGNLEVVRLLLDHGADLHLRGGYDGSTPLQSATRKGHHDIVKLLLDRGAEIEGGEEGEVQVQEQEGEGRLT